MVQIFGIIISCWSCWNNSERNKAKTLFGNMSDEGNFSFDEDDAPVEVKATSIKSNSRDNALKKKKRSKKIKTKGQSSKSTKKKSHTADDGSTPKVTKPESKAVRFGAKPPPAAVPELPRKSPAKVIFHDKLTKAKMTSSNSPRSKTKSSQRQDRGMKKNRQEPIGISRMNFKEKMLFSGSRHKRITAASCLSNLAKASF